MMSSVAFLDASVDQVRNDHGSFDGQVLQLQVILIALVHDVHHVLGGGGGGGVGHRNVKQLFGVAAIEHVLVRVVDHRHVGIIAEDVILCLCVCDNKQD